MPNIKLYASNKLEILIDLLADTIRNPLNSPFKPEVIVTQSKGMERWISMKLAENFGIWSNFRYYFPNEIILELFGKVIPGVTSDRIFETETASWQIMRLLPQCFSDKDFAEIKEYVAGEDMLKLYQLSSRIADTFDQYLTYRPEMILEWDKGKGSGWQYKLWRVLKKETHSPHPPELKIDFVERINKPEKNYIESLPERISLFGVSSLPKYHMDILAAVSKHIKINIFFMNPCREYWADIHTEKEIARTLGKYKDDYSAEELHLEKGNSLLASMGKAGADFLSLITEAGEPEEYPAFTENNRDSILHMIQNGILNMTEKDKDIAMLVEKEAYKSDMSVMINCCHSPMREVEVLYDNLLDMFNNDPELEPRDIIVMTPDIETYSPYISGVFGNPYSEHTAIPFSIADRSIRRASLAVETFFAVLDLTVSRFESGKVLKILECEEVYEKFDLTSGDLKIIRDWVRDTNINWGIDGEDRVKHGLPKFEENTWKAGLDRMLLGYAMRSEERLYQNILPYDIEGSESVILGKFIEYFDALIATVRTISGKHSLDEWNNILQKLLNDIFFPSQDTENINAVMEDINRLALIKERSGFHEKVELNVIRTWLENNVNEKRIKAGFLTGGVTFSEMLPMRSIPFKVICLIGMNDNVFPAADNPVSFNLIAQNPARGDRSRRNDDRHLFLESVISARNKLYMSYVGRSIRDNSVIPPSVLVSELLDYIENCAGRDAKIRERIVITHPLQAFSPGYFKGSGNLFSYSTINCLAGKISLSERIDTRQFIAGKLSEANTADKVIKLSDLTAFFTNPAKYLLNKSLGIYLDERTDVLNEAEPFEIEGYEGYRLGEILCGHLLAGKETDDLYEIIRASGRLPHGAMGEAAFKNMIRGVKEFAAPIREFITGEILQPLDINIEIRGYTLSGRLGNLWPEAMITYRYAKTKAKDRILSWISHLALNASDVKTPVNTILVCKDYSWEMGYVPDSLDILKDLLDIYIKGLNDLVPFFPETSLEYADYIRKNASRDEAMRKAESKWTGTEFNNYTDGEGSNPYFNICFRNSNPLTEDFSRIAVKLISPMLERQEKTVQLHIKN